MKNQALFPRKIKVKKSKYRLLQFLFGALRVNAVFTLQNVLSTLHRERLVC